MAQDYSQPPRLEYGYPAPIQQDHARRAQYPGASDHPSSPAKRQRTSFSATGRDPYEQEQRHGPFTTYPTQYHHAVSQGQAFMPGPPYAPGPYSDYSFGHQRTNSSATSSPYVSPQEVSGYPPGPGQSFQQYQTRESFYAYHQPPPTEPQHRHIPQLAYPVPPMRQVPIRNPIEVEAPMATSQPTARALTSLAQAHVHQSVARSHGIEEAVESSTETPLRAPDRPILPPLHSTLSSTQTQGTAPQLHSSNVLPRIESHGSGPIARQGDPNWRQEIPEAQPLNPPSTS